MRTTSAQRKARERNLQGYRSLRFSDIIQHEYVDEDGYWIELKPGYQNGADPGCHGITESTKAAAYRSLQDVAPCECEECRILLLAAGTKAVQS